MERHIWTEEELEFLRGVYPYYPNKEIAEMLKDKFGFEVTDKQLANARKNNGLPKKAIPNSGCYRKGDEPWNKGREMSDETKEKVKKT